jgi:alpha-tubulin suppressor-like RCC1 family protein
VQLPAGVTVTSVRAGCDHSVALTSAGTVMAWGNNDFGQLGNGTTTSSGQPVGVMLPAGTKVASISAGCSDGLVRTASGKVLAWGYNGDGELGDGSETTATCRSRCSCRSACGSPRWAAGRAPDISWYSPAPAEPG